MKSKHVLDIPVNAPLAVRETAQKVWEEWRKDDNILREFCTLVFEDIPDGDDWPEIPGQVRFSKTHNKWMIRLLDEPIPYSCGIDCCGVDVEDVYWLDLPTP